MQDRPLGVFLRGLVNATEHEGGGVFIDINFPGKLADADAMGRGENQGDRDEPLVQPDVGFVKQGSDGNAVGGKAGIAVIARFGFNGGGSGRTAVRTLGMVSPSNSL